MKREDIQTLDDLSAFIEENSKYIFVRERVDGRWGSFSLEELPVELALQHRKRFLDGGIIPVVVKMQFGDDRDEF